MCYGYLQPHNLHDEPRGESHLECCFEQQRTLDPALLRAEIENEKMGERVYASKNSVAITSCIT